MNDIGIKALVGLVTGQAAERFSGLGAAVFLGLDVANGTEDNSWLWDSFLRS